MKRRYVVCVDDATKEQQNAVTQYLINLKSGYWHWFSDVWLVTDRSKKWTAIILRDELKRVVPGAHILVVQIDGESTWGGFGPKKMFEWLKGTWSGD